MTGALLLNKHKCIPHNTSAVETGCETPHLRIKAVCVCILQVYELLDVLEASGPQGLAHYAVPHLSWEEVTALTGPGTVGLPVGYTPGAQQQRLLQLGRSAGAAALQLPAAATSGLLAAAAADEAGVAAGAGQDTRSLMEMQSGRGGEVAAVEGKEEATLVSSHAAGRAGLGWRQRGWQRAQYLVADGGV